MDFVCGNDDDDETTSTKAAECCRRCKKRGAGGTDALFKMTSNRMFVVSRTWEDSDESYDDAISSPAATRVVVAKRSPFSTTYLKVLVIF